MSKFHASREAVRFVRQVEEQPHNLATLRVRGPVIDGLVQSVGPCPCRRVRPVQQEQLHDPQVATAGSMDERLAALSIGAGRVRRPAEEGLHDPGVTKCCRSDERFPILGVGVGRVHRPAEEQPQDLRVASASFHGGDERGPAEAIFLPRRWARPGIRRTGGRGAIEAEKGVGERR